jgi:hypothetical protein
MSFRLDEGHGTCVYRLGVEDDGCHSLLDYEEIKESARVLECLARSLNAIVVEVRYIQNEVTNNAESEPVKVADGTPVVVTDSSFWKMGDGRSQSSSTSSLLCTEAGAYTRAEVVVRRVETHLLDATPIPLLDLTVSMEAMQIYPPPQIHPRGGNAADANDKSYQEYTSVHGDKDEEEKKEDLSVGETLSSRNIRIAVVGNVDAGE